jgi:hypothetical protein
MFGPTIALAAYAALTFGGKTMKTRKMYLAASVVFAAGCTIAPVDGMEVASTGTSISFSGYDSLAGRNVQVEVLGAPNPYVSEASAPGFALGPIVSTRLDAPQTLNGATYYQWNLSSVIPAGYWQSLIIPSPTPGGTSSTAAFARIRTRYIGAGIDGADSYGFTFAGPSMTDVANCYATNPSTALGRCKSKHSPVAYIYTTNFPRSVDLSITNINFPRDPSGYYQVRALVKNQGRHGVITGVSCSLGVYSNDRIAINPGEEKLVTMGLSRGNVNFQCTVSGTNENGTPEANTGNNTFVVP